LTLRETQLLTFSEIINGESLQDINQLIHYTLKLRQNVIQFLSLLMYTWSSYVKSVVERNQHRQHDYFTPMWQKFGTERKRASDPYIESYAASLAIVEFRPEI
jgi:hypothetical protein